MGNSEVFTSGTKKNVDDPSRMATKSHDIREDGVKGEPFTSSSVSQVDRELKPFNHKGVKSDADLHTDTTDLSDKDSGGFSSRNNQVKGDPFTKSGSKQVC